MGRVFLGRPGPWADENREASDHYTAKIGGLPDWPSPLMDWGSDFLKCSICGNKLCLVGQVPAPTSSGNLKVEERVLYIYGCIAPKCGSSPLSWRAICIQRSCEEKEPNSTCCDVGIAATPSVSAGKNDCWNDLDEKDEDVDLEELGRALAEAATVTSNSKKLNRQENSEEVAKLSPSRPTSRQVNDSLPVMPCFYIYTLEEPYLKDATSACMNYSSLSINVDNLVREEVLDEESYEYDRALMADRTYFKFKKRLDAYPEQCLRYSNGGKPLLSTKEIGDPGRCKLCGGPRQFEMQLMLPLLYFLHEAVDDAQKDALENWNWMTAIKYTCSKVQTTSSYCFSMDAVFVNAVLQTQ
ncbi:programmed cell death protein 2-like [Eucalyptus grandis]|uniref:programmed cell death protein 2-like n=1 Tax=Eucalyptus grandis TaxID=71139 RepID=UPI00192EF219|nr:programmed cell death protein 2-like [Eucalyptus grandis]